MCNKSDLYPEMKVNLQAASGFYGNNKYADLISPINSIAIFTRICQEILNYIKSKNGENDPYCKILINSIYTDIYESFFEILKKIKKNHCENDIDNEPALSPGDINDIIKSIENIIKWLVGFPNGGVGLGKLMKPYWSLERAEEDLKTLWDKLDKSRKWSSRDLVKEFNKNMGYPGPSHQTISKTKFFKETISTNNKRLRTGKELFRGGKNYEKALNDQDVKKEKDDKPTWEQFLLRWGQDGSEYIDEIKKYKEKHKRSPKKLREYDKMDNEKKAWVIFDFTYIDN